MPKMLHTGQVIIDLVMAVDKLPQAGGDVLAQSASFEAGGGFNVMAAAQRNGLPVVYLGRHGTGRFGDLAREAMNAEGIRIGIAERAERDTGLCVAITDASAERSFVSYIGAEGELTARGPGQCAGRGGRLCLRQRLQPAAGGEGTGAGGLGAGVAKWDQRGVRSGTAGGFAGCAADAGAAGADRSCGPATVSKR